MKHLTYLKLGAVCLCLGASSAEAQYFGGIGGGESENHTTLTIKSDGSSTLTNATVHPRKALEMQITSWERYSKRAEGLDSGDEETPVTPPPPAP